MDTTGAPGLGIDAGGTQTRWALADAAGTVLAEGHVAGASALQMAHPAGREQLRVTFGILAQQVLAYAKPGRIHAGLTGFGGESGVLAAWLAEFLGVAPEHVTVCNDIEIAYLDAFDPGAGYLVYAGTGSIGAYIDDTGVLHRAGGRGVTLDDGGGGFWIAREAMRRIWRREDEAPGAWRESPLAQAVFDHVGGSDWSFSRQFIYTRARGEIGQLALAVAQAAERDGEAREILTQAGVELARLAQALVNRFGARPVVLSGRAAALHPLILQSMRATLAASVALQQKTARPHAAAARLAARPQP
ncbi:N-acetylglucosamine kinase-like BadF-type ATPase [Pseudoduganella lurida]|uniref:N-acetylglucosamine kinase-like BadF-type ATPase n=1 Tax=Pseudoduganella lurida TaxID=1036180 RepID=A0A562QYH6_9BURK|nr:BadF/BadG/BcrA/BcrD ATPase family protein [Pseudoduganella lurida]TWI61837.1 N-acetylglucosamine kinase-like BadF-type ATPase [Pseudoduganella lurida]